MGKIIKWVSNNNLKMEERETCQKEEKATKTITTELSHTKNVGINCSRNTFKSGGVVAHNIHCIIRTIIGNKRGFAWEKKPFYLVFHTRINVYH